MPRGYPNEPVKTASSLIFEERGAEACAHLHSPTHEGLVCLTPLVPRPDWVSRGVVGPIVPAEIPF